MVASEYAVYVIHPSLGVIMSVCVGGGSIKYLLAPLTTLNSYCMHVQCIFTCTIPYLDVKKNNKNNALQPKEYEFLFSVWLLNYIALHCTF